MINLDDVREKMKDYERQKLLSKHKYKVFFDEKDNRWKTTLPDETKKNGRRLVAKRNKEKLIDSIICFYRDEEDEKYIAQHIPTLRNTFGEWLVYKSKHSASTSYARRIKNDWDKYYENDKIVDVPITDLTYIILDNWAHDIVEKHNLTKKQYYNLTLIIRQILDYCVERGYIELNPFSRVKVNKKKFTQSSKPESSTQVFTINIEPELKKIALKRYDKNNRSITPLAILLNFNLGLRVGELVALKWSDIEDSYIHINHMEITKYDVREDGNVVRVGYEVVDYVKSDAGLRTLYLNQEAKNILSLIKKRSINYDLYDSNYIFVSSQSNKRLTTSSINKYLYGLCDELNTSRKSSHKIRKTYISSLFDGRLNIEKIREIAGHEDERTSLNNYCFDRNTDVETEKILESLHKSII